MYVHWPTLTDADFPWRREIRKKRHFSLTEFDANGGYQCHPERLDVTYYQFVNPRLHDITNPLSHERSV